MRNHNNSPEAESEKRLVLASVSTTAQRPITRPPVQPPVTAVPAGQPQEAPTWKSGVMVRSTLSSERVMGCTCALSSSRGNWWISLRGGPRVVMRGARDEIRSAARVGEHAPAYSSNSGYQARRPPPVHRLAHLGEANELANLLGVEVVPAVPGQVLLLNLKGYGLVGGAQVQVSFLCRKAQHNGTRAGTVAYRHAGDAPPVPAWCSQAKPWVSASRQHG